MPKIHIIWNDNHNSSYTGSVVARFNKGRAWRDRNITLRSKIRLLRSLVISIFLYACESWTLTVDLQRRIQAMEMRCYRRLLNISYTEHITNVEVRNRIERAIGPYEDLLTTVKRRKLKWYGHVSRSSGPLKNDHAGYSQRRKEKGWPEKAMGR